MATVDIEGLDTADVLAALYNASRPQGMGFLHYDPKPMSREEARALLDSGQASFDYLKGRVMKIHFDGDRELEVGLYDRDNGHGAAELALASLRASGRPSNEVVAAAHETGRDVAAREAESLMGTGTVLAQHEGIATLQLGLADAADVLRPAVERARRAGG